MSYKRSMAGVSRLPVHSPANKLDFTRMNANLIRPALNKRCRKKPNAVSVSGQESNCFIQKLTDQGLGSDLKGGYVCRGWLNQLDSLDPNHGNKMLGPVVSTPRKSI